MPMTMPEPDPAPSKKPRKRKTKAERDAEQAAKLAAAANQPLFPPEIWLMLGGALLVVGLCIYFDPISFAEAGQASDDSLLRTIFVLMVGVFGKNPTALGITVLALLALGWSFIGWLKARRTRSKG
jgi:hypothetical protein